MLAEGGGSSMKLLKALCFIGSLFIVITILSGRAYGLGPASFSPDGQFIVFSLYRDGAGCIYRARSDGSDCKLLARQGKRSYYPKYSPDGSKIVFSSSSKAEHRQSDLYIMNSDGTNIIPLTTGPEHDVNPTFSPDGKRVYFLRAEWYGHYSPIASSQWHDYDVYSINIDGSELRAITNKNYYKITMLSISPDEKSMLIQMFRDFHTLWLFPIANPKEIKLLMPNVDKYIPKRAIKNPRINAKNPLFYNSFYDPQFSPDGKSILFSWGWRSRKRCIYIMDLETEEVRKLFTDKRFNVVGSSFSHDGEKIIFLNRLHLYFLFWDLKRSFELWQINVDGSNLHRIKLDL